MEKRRLGKTGWDASVIGFGGWAIGADWGETDDDTSRAALRAAAAAGVNFFDTADVYGDGRSERLLAGLRRELSEPIFVATKAGRRAPEQRVEHYRPENLVAWVDRSRENLETETLDLVQLHCPPTDLYYHPEVFAALDDLVARGAIAHYGVSVERVEEALKALDYPGVATVQIIYNIFRQRPADEVPRRRPGRRRRGDRPCAARLGVADRQDDARYEVRGERSPELQPARRGVRRRRDVRGRRPARPASPPLKSCARSCRPVSRWLMFALRFCLSDPAVSTVIPGAKNPNQARQNAAAGELGPLDATTLERLAEIYWERIAPEVHHRW